MKNYNSSKKQIAKKHLKLVPIISCPRSGSTILSNSLVKSKSIIHYCHEPFTPLSKVHFTPELLEKKKEDSYKNVLDITRLAKENDTILIKEMAAWVGLHTNEYQNFYELCSKPIVFLIRNPYLSTISRLKKLLKTLDMRYKESIIYTVISLLGLKVEKSEFSLKYQKEILEKYAKSEGFDTWKALVDYTQESEDFSSVSEIFTNLDIYNNAFSGFLAIKEQIDFLKNNNIPYLVIDSTVFRLLPEETLKLVCKALDIEFTEEMITWDSDTFEIPLGEQNRDYQKIWYTRAQNSNSIELPIEEVRDTCFLPKHINKYIETVDLPIYKEMLNDENLIKPKNLSSAIEKEGMGDIDPIFTDYINNLLI